MTRGVRERSHGSSPNSSTRLTAYFSNDARGFLVIGMGNGNDAMRHESGSLLYGYSVTMGVVCVIGGQCRGDWGFMDKFLSGSCTLPTMCAQCAAVCTTIVLVFQWICSRDTKYSAVSFGRACLDSRKKI